MGANELNAILNMQVDGVGTVLPGVDVAVFDEAHCRVPNGTTGLIAARSRGMIDGYYKDQEETRKRFHDGWFYTGDAGIMVGPRKIQVLGRADEMIIMGGVKQSPLPLEEALRSETGIKDAAVVGIKADDGGDVVCIALVPNDDRDANRPLINDDVV